MAPRCCYLIPSPPPTRLSDPRRLRSSRKPCPQIGCSYPGNARCQRCTFSKTSRRTWASYPAFSAFMTNGLWRPESIVRALRTSAAFSLTRALNICWKSTASRDAYHTCKVMTSTFIKRSHRTSQYQRRTVSVLSYTHVISQTAPLIPLKRTACSHCAASEKVLDRPRGCGGMKAYANVHRF